LRLNPVGTFLIIGTATFLGSLAYSEANLASTVLVAFSSKSSSDVSEQSTSLLTLFQDTLSHFTFLISIGASDFLSASNTAYIAFSGSLVLFPNEDRVLLWGVFSLGFSYGFLYVKTDLFCLHNSPGYSQAWATA